MSGQPPPRRRTVRRRAPQIAGYEDLRLIGRGGFSQVFRAWQPQFNREVAVKVLSRQVTDSRAYRLVERERNALGALSTHPNIVTIYDAGETSDGVPYLAMEYVPGGSLADKLAAGPGDWREALRIGIKLAGALETAHRADVLHRDIKPENVLLSEFGEPQLADFGIARLQASANQTRTMEVRLAVPFAPPELLDGQEPSVRSDVYSLACTLHSFVLGHPSFLAPRSRENTLVAVMSRIHLEAPADLRPLGVPDSVCRVLEWSMAKEAGSRPAIALELGRELQASELAIGLPATELPVAGLSQSRAIHVPAGMPRAWQATSVPTKAPRSQAASRPHRRRNRAMVLLVLLVLAPGLAGTLLRLRRGVDTNEGNGGEPATTALSAVPLPATTSPLPAAVYSLPAFTPATQFQLDSGWRRPRHDREDLVELERVDDSESLLSVFVVDDVVDRRRTYPSLAATRSRSTAQPVPADLVGWLGSHPNLNISSSEQVAASGGLQGRRIDLTLRGTNTACGTGTRRCSALFHVGGAVFVLLPEHRNRLYVFSVDGHHVLVTIETRPERFAELAGTVERIVRTLEIGRVARGE